MSVKESGFGVKFFQVFTLFFIGITQKALVTWQNCFKASPRNIEILELILVLCLSSRKEKEGLRYVMNVMCACRKMSGVSNSYPDIELPQN